MFPESLALKEEKVGRKGRLYLKNIKWRESFNCKNLKPAWMQKERSQ